MGTNWKILFTIAIGALTLLVTVEPSAAQGPSVRRSSRFGRSVRRPTTSPYLNLLRGGSRGFAFNYFQRVRPEMEFRSANAAMNRNIERLQRRSDQQEQLLKGLGQTGHSVGFMNLRGYFPLLERNRYRR